MDSAEDRAFFLRALETTLRIGLLLFLVLYGFQIALSFLSLIVWGIILAIATQPIHDVFCRVPGGRSSLAATVLVVAALLVLAPLIAWVFATSPTGWRWYLRSGAPPSVSVPTC